MQREAIHRGILALQPSCKALSPKYEVRPTPPIFPDIIQLTFESAGEQKFRDVLTLLNHENVKFSTGQSMQSKHTIVIRGRPAIKTFYDLLYGYATNRASKDPSLASVAERVIWHLFGPLLGRILYAPSGRDGATPEKSFSHETQLRAARLLEALGYEPVEMQSHISNFLRIANQNRQSNFTYSL